LAVDEVNRTDKQEIDYAIVLAGFRHDERPLGFRWDQYAFRTPNAQRSTIGKPDRKWPKGLGSHNMA